MYMKPVAATLAILLLGAIAAVAQTKEIRRTLPLTANGHLVIDTYKGEIRVTTWDQPSVELLARIEADGTDSESVRLVNDTDVRIDSTGDSIHLKSDYPRQRQQKHWNNENVSLPFVRYTLRMPRTAELRIKDYKSEIEVSDLNALVEIDTYKGDTKVHRQNGAIRMNTYKGHGTFEISSLGVRNSFETFKGNFDIAVPSSARFDVISESGPKASVRSAFPFVLPAGTYNRNSHFTARVNGGGSELVLKSYRGEVNLH